MSSPFAAYTGEPDIPAQMPTLSMSMPGTLTSTRIMSRPGPMPFSRTPTTLPPKPWGWFPV